MSNRQLGWAVLGLLGAAAVAGAVACFSDKGSAPMAPQDSTACEVPLSLIRAGHTIVAMRDFVFQPDSIRIPVGTTVTWVNCAPPTEDLHTTTSDTGVWGSALMGPGELFSFEFTEAGVFPYHCIPHRGIGMVGTVVVE